jgi:type IV secretion system protein VirD4
MLELLEMTKKNPDELYRLFEEQEKDPAAYYCSSYEYIKKQLNGKEKEVAEACLEQFALMREEPFQKLTESDNLNLYKVGDEKTALFVVMPPADRSYYFLGCVFVTQLLDGLLCHIEEDLEYKNLPHDVRIFLNNFADMGKVCNFPVNLMGIGKYNVNVTLVLQNLITLARRYPDDEMRSYFDNIVYFDSRNQFTLETVAGWLDNVFTPEQLAYEKPANTCVVLVHGKPSMLCSTYDIRNHPYYKELADAEDMFQYEEMEKYMIE